MNTEQERAEFEAWANGRCELHLVNPAGRYSSAITQFAWEAYQAGRAALAAQPAASAEPSEAGMDEYRAMVAAMEQINPATLPGLTAAQRCALGRFAKPAGRPAGDAKPVAWVAADTLNSPHPTCVSSLAYMSQLDKDRGREYVPLYAIQQPATVDGACAAAAIQFALKDPEGMTFLRLWNEGEFDTLRREWPDAPSEVYVGADPLATQRQGDK